MKSICEIFESDWSVIEIEKRIHDAGHQMLRELFALLLEEIDRILADQRDKAEWEVVGFMERTVITLFGEVVINRRLYRNAKDKSGYRVMLDEALGLEPHIRMTRGVKELAVELGTDMPFRKVASPAP